MDNRKPFKEGGFLIMLSAHLFPLDHQLQVDQVQVDRDDTIVFFISSSQATASCPSCGAEGTRIHSRYRRYPADLSCLGQVVRLSLLIRRFFCENINCLCRTFAEQFPSLLAPYARRTSRLARRQQQVAFEVGGEAGARILGWFGMPVSPDTLLRLVRSAPEIEVSVPQVLGVDDWASRKGAVYGTILVDLEKRKVIDLLPERSATVLEIWLREHPGVAIITRDRGGEYRKGATAGAPESIQVADRWHLLKNVREMLEQFLQNRCECLIAAAEADRISVSVEPNNTTGARTSRSYKIVKKARQIKRPTKEEQAKEARRIKREERYKRVLELKAVGLSNKAIANDLCMSTKTVRKYLEADSCPYYPENRLTPSKLDPYREYMKQRWQEGCYNASQLWREMREMGFDGSLVTVSRWVTKQRRLLPLSVSTFSSRSPSPPKMKRRGPWTPARASWILVKSQEELTEREKRALDLMRSADEAVATANALAQQFVNMVRQRQADCLAPWIETASHCSVPPLARFAKNLLNDFQAVHNALLLSWSNGQVEGQIHRLKLIKRQMYGRANFDLLRKRVIGLPQCV